MENLKQNFNLRFKKLSFVISFSIGVIFLILTTVKLLGINTWIGSLGFSLLFISLTAIALLTKPPTQSFFLVIQNSLERKIAKEDKDIADLHKQLQRLRPKSVRARKKEIIKEIKKRKYQKERFEYLEKKLESLSADVVKKKKKEIETKIKKKQKKIKSLKDQQMNLISKNLEEVYIDNPTKNENH